MRDDMYKVIVERPRRGGITTHASRRFRNDEDRSGKIGIKQGYADLKWLNENLAPLKRWLASNVNRPWSKVYGELCANIDRRNTVQEHIFTHIDQFVERETQLLHGKIYALGRWPSRLVPIEQAWAELYVHPLTGILRENTGRLARNRQRRAEMNAAKAELESRRRELGEGVQLHKLDGIWYEVVVEQIPLRRNEADCSRDENDVMYPEVWDVVRKRLVSRSPDQRQSSGEDPPAFGKSGVYAKRKRQLSSAELKRYQLTNENAGFPRRFRLAARCRDRALDSRRAESTRVPWWYG